MHGQNEGNEGLKARVSCAALLEWLPPVWRLDRAESTRRSRKYRRGSGEILIVNHNGRGWWDPLSEAKGDVFTLVQYLDPSLTFAGACHVLRGVAGITPAFSAALRTRRRAEADIPVEQRWERRPLLSHGSASWRYLVGQRCLPVRTLVAARITDAAREGPHGSAWFAHRDGGGRVTGIEMRGPTWRGFSAGGGKTLFRLSGGSGQLSRVAVCEAAIDALSLAAIEGGRRDTLYAATAGGMGPTTIAALRQVLHGLSVDPAGILIAATDADTAGRRLAARLQDLAAEAGVRFETILPPDGLNDWNDALRALAAGP
jgi:hypothetical protein